VRTLAAFLLAALAVLSAGALETTLIPPTVYVGDRARLIVALPSVSATDARASVVVTDRLPKTSDVTILRAELEARGGAAVAVVDFIPFSPGTLVLPPFEVGRVSLSGLRVTIASVLEGEAGTPEAAPAEKPLAAPGTAPLLYAFAFILLGGAAAGILLVRRALPFIEAARERRRKGLAVRSMRRVLSRISDEIGSAAAGDLLTVLFAELRSYLTYRTGVNCYALTAAELGAAFRAPRGADDPAAPLAGSDAGFLEGLLRRGDEVRFGAAPAAAQELREAVDGVAALIDRLEGGSTRC
jgi:hypothetical protein